MENFSKLSFRETLTILIPGIFIMLSITPIISEVFDDGNVFDNSNLNLLLLSISSFFLGIILYVLDIPKNIYFFNNATPTEQLNKNLKVLNIETDNFEIHNAYFKFYDELISSVQKGKTERLTSMYHFSMNIFINSLVILLIYLVYNYFTGSLIYYTYPIILIGLLSLISSLGLFYGKRKIKYYFTRQYKSFLKSAEYKHLISSIQN
jgi:hypothetical protein